MKHLFIAVIVLCGCGPSGEGSGFDLQLIASAGLLDQLSGFQVALVTRGSTLDCVAVEKTCLKSQVDPARFVPLKDASGKTKKALVLPLSLVAGTPSTQDLSLKELPLGKDFALVIEALNKETTPRLAGSSCTYVKELTAGTNAAVLAKVATLSPQVACDATIDP
jgi:hypothetical protein